MKKFFGLSLLIGFAFVFAACLNPVDDITGGDTTTGTTVTFKPGPKIVVFEFEPAPLVYGTDTIKGGAVAGTINALGGSGIYTYELVPGGDDDALFSIAEDENELVIADSVGDAGLPWGRYLVRLRVQDSEGLSYEEDCAMEVTLSPSSITGIKAYPYIVSDTDNKIKIKWDKSVGATGYRIYINTTNNINGATEIDFTEVTDAALRFKEITTYNASALPKGTTYYIWLKAYNESGDTLPCDPVKVTTSQPVSDVWLKDHDEDIIRWHSDFDYYDIDETTLSYNFDSYPGGYAYKGTIRHHVKFDPTEAAILQPHTQMGKMGEGLEGRECGVFIIEYIHTGDDRDQEPNYVPGYIRGTSTPNRYFQGIYYWGVGTTFEPDDVQHSLSPHIGMTTMYTSNSVWLNLTQMTFGSYCETTTYEDAVDRFTLKDMHKFIAFVAAPWYPVVEGMVEAGGCNHHHPITILGKDIGGGNYSYKFSNLNGRDRNIQVVFDIGGTQETFRMDAPGYSAYSGAVVTKTRTASSVTCAFSVREDNGYTNAVVGEVVFPNLQ
jgi:hypothetical protein